MVAIILYILGLLCLVAALIGGYGEKGETWCLLCISAA